MTPVYKTIFHLPAGSSTHISLGAPPPMSAPPGSIASIQADLLPPDVVLARVLSLLTAPSSRAWWLTSGVAGENSNGLPAPWRCSYSTEQYAHISLRCKVKENRPPL